MRATSSEFVVGCLVVASLFATAGDAAVRGIPVRGRVVDQVGEPLVGVTIEVTTPSSPDSMRARTKKDGAFTVVLPRVDWEYEFRFLFDGYHEVVMAIDPESVAEDTVEVTLIRFGVRLESELPITEGGATTLPRHGTEPTTAQRRQAIELYNDGVTALEAGEVADATAAFLRATVVDPRFAEPYRALAAIAEEAEDWKSAARAAKAMLRFEPDDLDAKWTLYNAMIRVGSVDSLIAAARRLATADRRSVDEMVRNARTLLSIDEFEAARALAEVATGFAPDHVGAWFVIGVSCKGLGEAGAAKAAIERFIELAPADHPDVAAAMEVRGRLE